jgi:hypothetical protein
MKRLAWFAAPVFVLILADAARSQQTTTQEEIDNGVRYRVTKSTWQQSVPYTEYETREEHVYRPQQATDYQNFQQTYAIPVTEYRWVSRLNGWWNPFSRPYWTHHLEPFTRWDYRAATVQVPMAKTEWVEETRTVQVPVTRYRTVENTSTSRVALSVPTGGTAPQTLVAERSAPAVAPRVADRYGSERLASDPPRESSRLQ